MGVQIEIQSVFSMIYLVWIHQLPCPKPLLHTHATPTCYTFSWSSDKGTTYYKIWQSHTDVVQMVSNEMCASVLVTAVLRHNGAWWLETNSTTDKLRGCTEEPQSFNRLLAVLEPHIHCGQWVGCTLTGVQRSQSTVTMP